MLDYSSLVAVDAVIREGTFERGAATLGITPSAISQRVRGLEERLGAIVIVRGQPCRPTALGRKLCAHLDRVRLLEHDMALDLGKADGPNMAPVALRVAVNADSLATWFTDAIGAFENGHNVSLHLTVADELVTADHLVSGEAVAAVSSNPAAIQGCKTTRLGALRYVACASPDYVEKHFPQGVTAASLTGAPHLRFNGQDRLQHRWAHEAYGVDLTGTGHFVPSTEAFIDLSLKGVAWGMHPVPLVKGHLAEGRLLDLSPVHKLDVDLYWTAARLHALALRRLTDAVCKTARKYLIT